MDIIPWLEGLGLERYARTFREHDIDAEVLPFLGDADLDKLGVTLGHRKRLLNAIASLSGAEAASAATPRRAELRQLTIMFVDLVGSTMLSQRLDPEEMRDVLGAFRVAVAGGVEQFCGTVAKFLGDGVVAYFGCPLAHEDDPERAVRAGLRILDSIAMRRTPDGELLAARIGIATGLTLAGDRIGEGSSQEEAVVGETPNLAARLQALAEPNRVVISAATKRLIAGRFELADLGARTLKGFDGTVSAWAVLGPSAAHGRFAARAAAGLTALVGRERELELLLDRWEKARQGAGQVVLLSGEAGIGKSRIAWALSDRLHGEATALLYQCSPHHLDSSLWPVIDHLERRAGFERGEPPAAKIAKLEALLQSTMAGSDATVPLLAALLALPTDGLNLPLDLGPKQHRDKTLEALVGELEGMAAGQPVLAVLEDAHWCDPTTLELFDLVVAAAERLPILLLLTYRPEFVAPWPGRAHVTEIALDRLDRADAVAMIEGVAGSMALPTGVIDALASRTDGVPLFVEELTKAMLESGSLRQAGAHYVVDGTIPEQMVPETLQDSLLARLDRLAPAKEVAQIGAAIGRDFSYQLLAAVAPLKEHRLARALDELVESELVFTRGEPPETIYTFKHALIQDAAYSTLLKSRRRQLHASIAEALQRLLPDQAAKQPELLAHHFTEAGLHQPASEHWQIAGELSLNRAAMKEAAALFDKALSLLAILPAGSARDERELDLLLAIGRTQQALKGSVSADCGRTYTRARELAERTGDAPGLIDVLKGQMYFHHGRTELDRAGDAAKEWLRISQQLASAREMVEAYDAVATVSLSSGRFGEALDLCQQAQRLLSDTTFLTSMPDLNACLRSVLLVQSQTLAALGYRQQALAGCDEAVGMARASNHDYELVVTLGNACFVDQVCGRRKLLGERAGEMIQIAGERAFPTWLARGLIFRGWVNADSTSRDLETSEMRRGLAELYEIGAKVSRPYFLALLASAYGSTGQARAGIETADEALELTEPAGEKDHQAELHRIKGDLMLACGDRSTAEACFTHAMSIARRQGAKTWELRAAMCLARLWGESRRRAKALDLLAPVHAWFSEGHDGPDLQESAMLLESLS